LSFVSQYSCYIFWFYNRPIIRQFFEKLEIIFIRIILCVCFRRKCLKITIVILENNVFKFSMRNIMVMKLFKLVPCYA